MTAHCPNRHRFFRLLNRIGCPDAVYYWLLDRLTDNNGWRPLSMREPHRIKVTREQVEAARIHVQAYRSAGLTPDPMIVKLANAEECIVTAHGPERRGPERPGPDYPAEWDGDPEEEDGMEEQRAAADELTRIGEEMGLYDDAPSNGQQARRLAVDADGYVWWVNDDDTWSMARINPDNSPIPQPVTYYEPIR